MSQKYRLVKGAETSAPFTAVGTPSALPVQGCSAPVPSPLSDRQLAILEDQARWNTSIGPARAKARARKEEILGDLLLGGDSLTRKRVMQKAHEEGLLLIEAALRVEAEQRSAIHAARLRAGRGRRGGRRGGGGLKRPS